MKNKYIEKFIPFLMFGFAIAIMIGLLVIIGYVFVWGLVIAGVLWIISSLKNLYQSKFGTSKTTSNHKGVIIEHDDLK